MSAFNINASPIRRPDLDHARWEIHGTYGVNTLIKPKRLLKFGRGTVGSSSWETVWARGGDETFPTSNAIDTISSDDAGDTQSVVVEGHTISAGLLTFVVQSATLNGQNKVVLDTPLARTTRIYNNGTTDFAGTVYVYEDDTVTAGVPQTTAKIHLQTGGDNNQSLKAASATSQYDFYIITEVYTAVRRNTSAVADFDFQMREVSTSSKAFRTRLALSSAREAAVPMQLSTPVIVPKNHDFRWRAIASTNSVQVSAFTNGFLALDIENSNP